MTIRVIPDSYAVWLYLFKTKPWVLKLRGTSVQGSQRGERSWQRHVGEKQDDKLIVVLFLCLILRSSEARISSMTNTKIDAHQKV